jgi:hypothetical protein
MPAAGRPCVANASLECVSRGPENATVSKRSPFCRCLIPPYRSADCGTSAKHRPGLLTVVAACHARSLARKNPFLAWYHSRHLGQLLLHYLLPGYQHHIFFCNVVSLRQKNQHNAVAAQEEFADEAVAVDRLSLLSICIPGRLAPHLLHVLQHHVAVAVESLDARE